MSENNKGVPQLLHVHVILALWPNLNLKLELEAVEFRQFPVVSTKENAFLLPKEKILAILYPVYPELTVDYINNKITAVGRI